MAIITLLRTVARMLSALEIGSLEVTKVPRIRRKAHLKVAGARKGIKVKEKEAAVISPKAEESREHGEVKVASKVAGAANNMVSKAAGSQRSRITTARTVTSGILVTNGLAIINSGILVSNWTLRPRTGTRKEAVKAVARRAVKVEVIRTR